MREREERLALEAAARSKTSGDLYAKMEAAKVAPLWDRFHELFPPDAPPRDPGIHYRWADMRPLIEQAAAEVSVEEAERRVLMLWNPAFGRQVATTTGLYGALQVLLPGERARPHRHTGAAFRFVLEGTGAETVVNGVSCPMAPGDLILTPNWTWHEHANSGEEMVVWFDGLDVPLIDFYNAWVAEFGPVGNIPPDAGTVADEAYRQAGLVPEGADAGALPYSPMFRYPYGAVCAALAAMPAGDDGAKRLHYTNPATGRRVMPTMDLYMLDLEKGAATRPYRTTSNAMAVVAEGAGVTTVGDVAYRWAKNDVFTLPHNSWISHTAESEPARLFLNTDRALLADLGYLREEWG